MRHTDLACSVSPLICLQIYGIIYIDSKFSDENLTLSGAFFLLIDTRVRKGANVRCMSKILRTFAL